MGNRFANAVDKWSLNPRNVSGKTRRKKGAPVEPYQLEEAHMYDTVAEIPVYSVPTKKKQPQEELHYAKVEVLQGHSPTSRRNHHSVPLRSDTEYATIDFRAKQASPVYNGGIKGTRSEKPADILIPTGSLRKPVPQRRPKTDFSQKSHGH